MHIADGSASIAGLFEDVAEHGITGFYTPPPLIRYLLKIEADRANRALATVRTIEIGSAPVTGDEVRLFMMAWSRFDAPAAFAWARDWPTSTPS